MKIIRSFIYNYYQIQFMGFLKKIKDTAEKGVEKGTDLGKQGVEKGAELGTKGYMMVPKMLPKKDTTKLKGVRFFF